MGTPPYCRHGFSMRDWDLCPKECWTNQPGHPFRIEELEKWHHTWEVANPDLILWTSFHDWVDPYDMPKGY